MQRFETQRHIYEPRITHQSLEQSVESEFIKSPDYSLDNVNGYSPITFITSLINPYDNNSVCRRTKRFVDETLYVVPCDRLDKISTIAVVVTAIIACIIFYRSYTLDAEQVYVFKNDQDNSDPIKVAQLQAYNATWNGLYWFIGKTAMYAIPGIATFWRIFKRTSVHKKGFEFGSTPKTLTPKLKNLVFRAMNPSLVATQ